MSDTLPANPEFDIDYDAEDDQAVRGEPGQDRPILSTDPDDVIEENITAARLNNEYERTLTVEAPENQLPIRATEVPRDNELRDRDVTPVGYASSRTEARVEAELEVALGPFVGPIDGEGTTDESINEARRTGPVGGRYDEDGNLLHDPGIGPDFDPRAALPGVRDENGDLIADHDGDGIAMAHEPPIREATGAGVDPDASEEDQHGSRSEQDADRDLDEAAEEELAPEHDPDASEEEQKGGRGADDRDLGDAEDAGQAPEYQSFLDDATVSDEAASVATASQPIGAEAIAEGVIPAVDPTEVPTVNENPTQPDGQVATEASPGPSRPADDASAEEWRTFARDNNVEVSATANKASTKAALRDAGVIR